MGKQTISMITLLVMVVGSQFVAPLSSRAQESSSQSASTRRRETSIIGRLINESGQPIPGAAINVRKVGGSAGRSLGTDEDGKFHVDDLTPGAYSVSAYVPGYVASDLPDRQYYRPGETVILRMTKGGVISGTVTNSFGEPVIAGRVTAIRVRDAEGRPIRRAAPTGNSRQTDDRGVYRIYGLQAGSYIVSTGSGGQAYYPVSGYDGDAPTYHPSTTRDAATEVTVQNGGEITGIDIRYRGDRGHIVSGSLSGALGSESGNRGVTVFLSTAASGAIESSTYVPLRGGERAFALYGVPDGEFLLHAQVDIGNDSGAASVPRRVTVKGTDATGIDLALAPLGSIAGRIVLETLPESERKGDCKDKRAASTDEIVIVARRDEKPGTKDQSSADILAPLDGTPDQKGEFKIASLTAGRYRLETRLPTEDWFIRSITVPTSATSKQQSDVTSTGLVISSGQRVTDLTVTLVEGAASVQGKVVAASENASLPARLRVYLVPAEADSSEAVLRFAEAPVENDGAFAIGNLAPGQYFVIARALSDEEFIERIPRPLAWDATTRIKLRGEAEAAKIIVELQRCQRVSDYLLKYSPPPASKKRPARPKP